VDHVNEIIRRIEAEAGVPGLSSVLIELKPTDLQSLLMMVYREHAKRRDPRSVLSDYVSNRFYFPSECDPAVLNEWDSIALSHLPEGFDAVELSPVAPLGSVSRLAPISQDWVPTTIRNMEVVSDPTNILAIRCAVRRKELMRSGAAESDPVNLACSHRAVRAQRYRNARALQHFRMFSLCSAGRNTEDLRFDIEMATEHIRFYLRALRAFLGPEIHLMSRIVDLSQDSHREEILSRSVELLRAEFGNTEIAVDKTETEKEKEYYRKLRFTIHVRSKSGERIELVEGGDTDWTQKLLNNAKERLVVSGMGSERLCRGLVSRREPP
jgi:hypothetical protein